MGGARACCSGVRCNAPQPRLLPPVSQETGDPLTGRVRHSELGELAVEEFNSDGVQRRAEVQKQDLSVSPRM